jgi:hypothetical protein
MAFDCPTGAGERNKKAGETIAGFVNVRLLLYFGQILPSRTRMIRMTKIAPTTPLGPYPQAEL